MIISHLDLNDFKQQTFVEDFSITFYSLVYRFSTRPLKLLRVNNRPLYIHMKPSLQQSFKIKGVKIYSEQGCEISARIVARFAEVAAFNSNQTLIDAIHKPIIYVCIYVCMYV